MTDPLTAWGFAISCAGFAVSAGGWGTTWVQVRKTRKASEAAVEALAAERKRAATLKLAHLPFRLKEYEAVLSNAIGTGDREAVIAAVHDCRDCGVEIQSIIEWLGPSRYADEHGAFAMVLGLVDVCLADLQDEQVTVLDACRRIIDKLSRASRLAEGLAITMAFGSPGGDE